MSTLLSSFKFYIKDEYISCHWVGYSKINPIDVAELFKIKAYNDEKDSTLKVDDQTEETVDTEDITEEAHANTDNLDE